MSYLDRTYRLTFDYFFNQYITILSGLPAEPNEVHNLSDTLKFLFREIVGVTFVLFLSLCYYTVYRLASHEKQYYAYLKQRQKEVNDLYNQTSFITPSNFIAKIVAQANPLINPQPPAEIIAPFLRALHQIYTHELPNPPTDPPAQHLTKDQYEKMTNVDDPLRFTSWNMRLEKYHNELEVTFKLFTNPDFPSAFFDAFVDSLVVFCNSLPPLVKFDPEKPHSFSTLSIPFHDAMPRNLAAATYFTDCFYKLLNDYDFDPGFSRFESIRAVSKNKFELDKNTRIDEFSNKQYFHRLYYDTPFHNLIEQEISIAVFDQTRFEHQWIVAGSGHGKTQTLQYLILQDLKRVADDECSIVVIDSQGDLIRNIRRLKIFAPGEELHDKLCIIDPTDIEYPCCLNLFDAGQDRFKDYSPLQREQLTNGIIELYDFVLGSLLDAEMTQKQTVIFRFITRLLLHIPDATIHTFRELLEPDGYEKYKEHISHLAPTARSFFETEFQDQQFDHTKKEVLRRLWGILENQTFERMFSHPRNKLNLFDEMNQNKVILINTAKSLLKENGCQIFGRFFIAMIAQAAQERAALQYRNPTFVYIDECQDYLDRNTAIILQQARKFKVGLILAHQYLAQIDEINPHIKKALAANTSIKFAGGVSVEDARALAPMIHADADTIEKQRKGCFSAYFRNAADHAVTLHFPFGVIEKLNKMTDEEAQQVKATMRARYATPIADVPTVVSYKGPPDPHYKEPDEVDVSPSEKL